MQKRSTYTLPSAIIWIIIAGFLLHFFTVLGYQFGNDVLPKKVNVLIDRYSVPWFYQNYYMFAPDPTYHFNAFIYRIETDDGWTDWQEPGAECLQQHWNNRFGNASDRYDMFYHLSNALFEGIEFIHFMEAPTDQNWHGLPAHEAAERYIFKVSQFSGANILTYQVGVKTEYHYFNAQRQVERNEIVQTFPKKSMR